MEEVKAAVNAVEEDHEEIGNSEVGKLYHFNHI